MKPVLSLLCTVVTEDWALLKTHEKGIQSAEMLIHRRMLTISWTERGWTGRGRPERGSTGRGRPECGRPERGRPERGRTERDRSSDQELLSEMKTTRQLL